MLISFPSVGVHANLYLQRLIWLSSEVAESFALMVVVYFHLIKKRPKLTNLISVPVTKISLVAACTTPTCNSRWVFLKIKLNLF